MLDLLFVAIVLTVIIGVCVVVSERDDWALVAVGSGAVIILLTAHALHELGADITRYFS